VFAPRITLSQLAMLCRSLGTMLDSGVRLLEALKVVEQQQRGMAGRVLKQISADIRKGSDLAAAFREHGSYFPELLVDMLAVADQTGSLPEVLKALADHYDNLIRLRRTFLGAITWPVIQLLAAILIIALLIWVLGLIAESNPGAESIDPLGFGLKGATGAALWLTYCFGALAAIVGGYFLATRGFRQAKAIHTLLLAVPVVGHCMRSFAVARFSWAFALTQQAGMEIQPSLEASLKATNNGAFQAATPRIVATVMAGEELTTALEETALFPRQFVEMVRVGERSGTVPETLERLSPQFEEDARRALHGMTVALSYLVWGLVAMLIIFLIFRVMLFYVGILNDALNQAM
jgi:type IV pilus assembly protein PilC